MTYINDKYTETNAPEKLDYDEHVDGICDPKLDDYLLNRDCGYIWENGFQLKVEEGTWYEVYLKDRAHGDGPKSRANLSSNEQELIHLISSLYMGSDLGFFPDYGQITFYVSDKEELLDEDLILSSFERINTIVASNYIDGLKDYIALIDNSKKSSPEKEAEDMILEKSEILSKVKSHQDGFYYASEKMKADKEVVMEAVKSHQHAISYASEELKADKEVVMAAIDYNVAALEFASEEIKSDKEVVIAAVKLNADAFLLLSEELKADKEVVIEMLKHTRYGLSYGLYILSEEMKADKDVVIAAVKYDGSRLEDASEELKADKEVVMAAVKSHNNAIYFASEELKADKEVVMAAVKSNGSALCHASEELKADKEVVMAAFKSEENDVSLNWVSEELKADKEVVIAAVKTDDANLEAASEELQNDPEIKALLK